jgi:ElaB/YqjD/DUF883 family membrane-anchored ribosome-binding protein
MATKRARVPASGRARNKEIKTMRLSRRAEPDLATVRGDIAALMRDVTRLMDHLKAGASNGAQSAAAQIDGGVHRIYDTVASEAGRSAKAIGRQVEQQPIASLLIAAGVGYIGARLFSPRLFSR